MPRGRSVTGLYVRQHVKQSFRKFMRRLDEDSTLGSSPVSLSPGFPTPGSELLLLRPRTMLGRRLFAVPVVFPRAAPAVVRPGPATSLGDRRRMWRGAAAVTAALALQRHSQVFLRAASTATATSNEGMGADVAQQLLEKAGLQAWRDVGNFDDDPLGGSGRTIPLTIAME
eukprot:s2219_g3.t1